LENNNFLQALLTEAAVCMFVAKKSVSYAATEGLISILKKVVDDSEILKAIKLSHTKISYVLRNGLLPYFKDQLIKDVSISSQQTKVVICFDETTNCQISSQLDFYCQYWSFDCDQVIIRYLGSFFLGRKTAVILQEKLFLVLNDYHIEPKQVIDISRDNCSTNEAVIAGFKTELQKDGANITFTNIGGCNLHKAYNSFKMFLSNFAIRGCDIIEFCSDVNAFFCNSSARKEEFKVNFFFFKLCVIY
jgi:hypothetical protein